MIKLLTPRELSDLLNCKLSTVYAWAKAGEVPARKINGLVRFDPVEIDQWIEKSRLVPVTAKRNTSDIQRPIGKSDIDRIIQASIGAARRSNGKRKMNGTTEKT